MVGKPQPKPIMTTSDNSAHHDIAKWTRWVACFTFCLVVASGVSDYFIWKQWSAAVDLQSETREQLRAYVAFEATVNLIANNKEGKPINYIFAPQFRNWGATRTGKFYGWTSVKYFPKDVPNSQDFNKPFDKIDVPNATVGANSSIQLGPVSLSADEAIKAKNGDGVVVIWGHVDWSDIFHPGDVHGISFCSTLKPVSSEGDERILFQPVPYRVECNTGM